MPAKLRQTDAFRWEVQRQGKMRVPGVVYASERMIAEVRGDACLEQVANVAALPGIVRASLAMPDVHTGYGFSIGGVAAFDADAGVVSPGGVGYDINCGVRLLRTSLSRQDVAQSVEDLSIALFRAIPSGVGSTSVRRLSARELESVLRQGSAWAVSEGYGTLADLEVTEERGSMPGADPAAVSARAKERGLAQLGSLGSGNHFCELGYVAEIYDSTAAAGFGLHEGDVTVMLHTGSRGLGYQVADDYLRILIDAAHRHRFELPDRQLCAAPLSSPEAQRYFGAMVAAANYAFANRQMLAHAARQVLSRFFCASESALGLQQVYDLSHNIAKWEEHDVDGKRRRVCVHRKGATRAFGPGHPDIPVRYRAVGQPVLIPGDMGRYSFVLAGTEGAMLQSFGSTCHGAGRRLSRQQAKKTARGRPIFRELRERGIFLQSGSRASVAEEIPEAYKDVAEVVEVVCGAGIGIKVAKLAPLAVIKG